MSGSQPVGQECRGARSGSSSDGPDTGPAPCTCTRPDTALLGAGCSRYATNPCQKGGRSSSRTASRPSERHQSINSCLVQAEERLHADEGPVPAAGCAPQAVLRRLCSPHSAASWKGAQQRPAETEPRPLARGGPRAQEARQTSGVHGAL